MTRPAPAPGRQREKIVGAVIVLVGVAVLVLSIVALVGAADGTDSDVTGPSVKLPGRTSASATAGSSPGASGSRTATGSPTTSASSGGSSGAPSAGSSAGAAATAPLVVLNNTSRGGLAQQAAASFTQGGWTVTGTANFRGDILSTCAYYDPSVPGAQAAAQALMTQFPAIKRVKEKFGDLPAGPVVVVVTDDYTAR